MTWSLLRYLSLIIFADVSRRQGVDRRGDDRSIPNSWRRSTPPSGRGRYSIMIFDQLSKINLRIYCGALFFRHVERSPSPGLSSSTRRAGRDVCMVTDVSWDCATNDFPICGGWNGVCPTACIDETLKRQQFSPTRLTHHILFNFCAMESCCALKADPPLTRDADVSRALK